MKKEFKLSRLRRNEAIQAYIFLLPTIIFFIVILYIPIVSSFIISFRKYSLLSSSNPFVGLKNYIKVIQDPTMAAALKNTFYYVFFTVGGATIIALALALMMDRLKFLENFYRTIYLIPLMISMVAISQLWLFIYDYITGPLNYFLGLLGIAKQPWLTSTKLAMPAVIIMSIWTLIGKSMIIFVAGLKNIPEEYYEIAKIDGANAFQILKEVTLPLLKPITLVVIVVSTIDAFQVFTQIYVMTEGGPMHSTTVIVYEIYRKAFLYFRMGEASALAYILFTIVLILSLLQLRVLRTKY